jgi:hypothetical protein
MSDGPFRKSREPLRFPPRRHAVIATLKIAGAPGWVHRSEVGQVLREVAEEHPDDVAAALRQAADVIDPPKVEPE